MNFLTNDKLVIVGAGGMIGSNMVQSALMLGLTPNICLYDIFEPGVHGVFDEIQQCAFPGVNVTYTVNPEEAFTGAKYIISSGGAPRKEGMTREDLLKGNCKIAAEFGDNIKKYCPEVEHVVVIFNPADVTALTALIHSGLKPNQLTSLAALDSTRLQQALASSSVYSRIRLLALTLMVVTASRWLYLLLRVKVDGKPLAEMGLSDERWEEIKHHTVQGGSNIIKLRGRSSFQSPAYNAVKMIEAAMGGEKFTLPAGCYVNCDKCGFKNVMMAMPTTIDKTGVHFTEPTGTEEELASLAKSYEHLCKMRDEIVELGIVPPVAEWKEMNPNL